MATLSIGEFEDSFVIHFGGEFKRINAYTLATTLINLADAAKAANAVLNPGYEVEVVVEALGAGSFKAKVRTLYKGAGNLFSSQNLKAIVLSVIAAFIYERTFSPDRDVVVNVGHDEVVIQQGDTRVVIPREVHDALQEVEPSQRFRSAIGGVMRTLDEDESIESIGLTKDEEEEEPPAPILRNRFGILPESLLEVEGDVRELTEITEVEILRAILERSKRLWQFVWNGIRISAPVTDQKFYDDFFAHRITIAPGDVLRVRLEIRQKRAPDVGIFINDSYEVVEVIRHIQRPHQKDLHEKKGGDGAGA